MNIKAFENINPLDNTLKKEVDHIDVDISVQAFDEEYSHLEDISDFDEKIIKYIERMIRGSYEYKEYIKYLKDELDIKKCVLTPGLDLTNSNFQLEFHHYPLSLFEIVDIIGHKLLKDESKTVSLFDIMELVMKEHYAGNVGLVPLSSTSHEMFHNGSVIIPIESVYGDYNNFLDNYKDYIYPETVEKIIYAKTIHKDEANEFNTKLKKNTLDYKINYNNLLVE